MLDRGGADPHRRWSDLRHGRLPGDRVRRPVADPKPSPSDNPSGTGSGGGGGQDGGGQGSGSGNTDGGQGANDPQPSGTGGDRKSKDEDGDKKDADGKKDAEPSDPTDPEASVYVSPAAAAADAPTSPAPARRPGSWSVSASSLRSWQPPSSCGGGAHDPRATSGPRPAPGGVVALGARARRRGVPHPQPPAARHHHRGRCARRRCPAQRGAVGGELPGLPRSSGWPCSASACVFEALFGAPIPGTTVLTLPEVTLPSWMAGARLGGDVTLEALVAALYSGLQLVAIFACVGAANALANPTRLLKSVPGALYEVGVAVVVALTLVPSALDPPAADPRGPSTPRSAVPRPRARSPAPPLPCSPARWSAPWLWPPRWTRAGSGGSGSVPPANDASPRRSPSPGCSRCSSAATHCSTPAHPHWSPQPCSRSASRCR